MNSLRRLLFLVLTIAFLASCSSSLVYDRLDWLIPWWVDGYVDLTGEQKESLREQLTPLLQWHRQEELASYQRMLDRVENELEQSVSTDQVEQWIEELLQATSRVEKTLLRVALDFGAKISDAQMQELVQSLNDRQADYEDEFLSRTDSEYVKENAENLEGLMKRIIGRLRNEQNERLAQAAGEMKRFDAVWLEDRGLWLNQLELYLQRNEGWQEKVLKAHDEREANRSANYDEIAQHNTQVIAASIADVLNARSDKQKDHTARELEDMRTMLQKLIGRPAAGPK